jgi:hypothetical protein
MRRRDFAVGVLLAAAMLSTRAEEPAKQRRMAIVIPAGPVAIISETSSDTLSRRLYQPFYEELRRLGDIEGRNLAVERYSGQGRREGYPDLARDIVNRNPKKSRFAACASLLTSPATRRPPPKCEAFRLQPRGSPLRHTGCWREGFEISL